MELRDTRGNRWRPRLTIRPLVAIVGLLFVSMILAACGGSGEISASTTAAGTESTTSTTAPSTTAAGTESTTSTTAPSTTAATPPPNDFVLGVDYLGLQFPFIVALKNAVDSEADKAGVKLVELDAGADVATQIADVEQLIVRGVDIILFNGLDRDASVPALDAAAKAGIPVVLFNTFIDGPHVTWIGSENVQAGELLGKFVLAALDASESGKLRVLYIRGIPGHPASLERDEGMRKALGDRVSDITFVERVADFNREKALRVTEEALTADANFDVIVAQNDDMILGALRAIESAGLTGKYKTIAVDGVPEALEAVADGSLTATVYQDAGGQGRGAVQAALRILNGETVEKSINIPFVLIDSPEAATKLLVEVRKLYGSSGG